MDEIKHTKQMFKGALLLTAAGVISKILSVGYRIPLQNITGDVGFYIYQQIYPFLGTAFMLSLYGFPAAISKLVAEERERGLRLSFRSFYMPVTGLLITINMLLFGVLFGLAPLIAKAMGDNQLTGPLRAASLPFLFVPFSSICRGIFQGLNNMKPTAVSQVVEQVVRVSVILVVSLVMVHEGRDLYEVGSGAAAGSLLGACAAVFVLAVMFTRDRPWYRDRPGYSIPWKKYIRTILLYGMFICLNYMMFLLIQFADAFTLVPNLIEFGMTRQQAMEWKGVFDRGQPLVQLGTVLGSSLALALVPTVTRRQLNERPVELTEHVKSAWKFSFILSTGAAIGLMAIFPYANILLFEDDAGTGSLQILALSILFTSLALTLSSILQGLGDFRWTAVFVVTGMICKGILNELLVPVWGIAGSAVATVAAVMVILLLNVARLKQRIPHLSLLQFRWRSLVISLAGMLIFLYGLDRSLGKLVLAGPRIDYVAYTLIACFGGAAIYVFLLIKLRAFTDNELEALPFGSYLAGLNKGGNKNGK
ncbi:putative polysaccharide biosynthesis protein [Virgibacillus senegalensis]|uniref:putative polysaccharide biosynthesis protein n=1 Tax=Virgibacillus senegalensis TaxID=1499679 RepID=UPI0018FEB96A|nr:polysaccharide biosynthesis protein [Virgibacillus senegalensis]